MEELKPVPMEVLLQVIGEKEVTIALLRGELASVRAQLAAALQPPPPGTPAPAANEGKS